MERLTRRDYKYIFCEYDNMKCADQEEDGGCQYCDHMMQMMKKLAHYEDLEVKLASVYGECGGLLEKVVEGLVKHEGVEFEKPMKARLLTDDDVDKWDRLKGARNRIVGRLIDGGVPFPFYDKDIGFGEGLDYAIEIVKEEMND